MVGVATAELAQPDPNIAKTDRTRNGRYAQKTSVALLRVLGIGKDHGSSAKARACRGPPKIPQS